MEADFEEFLTAKGGAGVVVTLYDEKKTFSEILTEIDATGTTLSKRLDEANEAGLITTTRTHRHGQRTKEMELTEFGYEIARILSRRGVVTNYRKMMTHKETMEDGLGDAIEEIYKSEGVLMQQASEKKSPKTNTKISERNTNPMSLTKIRTQTDRQRQNQQKEMIKRLSPEKNSMLGRDQGQTVKVINILNRY